MMRWLVIALLTISMPILSALDLKSPPNGGVSDPGGYLTDRFYKNITYRLGSEAKYRNFEIFLILFEEEPSQGASILAKQAGESWSEGEYWAVIYQVGPEGEPDCLVGGDLMGRLPEDIKDRTVRGARGRALLVSTPLSRLEELVSNLSDGFAMLYVQASDARKVAFEKHEANWRAKEQRKKDIKVLGFVILAILIGLSVLGFNLWKKHLRKWKPVEFPQTSVRRRLSAPSSGGGDVLVKYGRK